MAFNIKNLGPRRNGQFRQGFYKPLNPHKYIGDPNTIIYRSSWEHKFCISCDINPNIIKWSSEPIAIPYHNIITKKSAKYYVDFFIMVKKGEDLCKYIVEVKPSSQLKKPVFEGNQTEKKLKSYNWLLKAYIMNKCKFEAAQIYAKGQGWEFVICTETFFSNI